MISFNPFSSEIVINIYYGNSTTISVNSNGVCLYTGDILSCVNKLQDDVRELNSYIDGLDEPYRKRAKSKRIIMYVSVCQDFNKQNSQGVIKADIENIRRHLYVIKSISQCEIVIRIPKFLIG